ncbi:hypothetical protein [Halopseudomonas aestusnigri]|uniref:Uncharacterized protein n=1 Tax=Halopseudomonas aestusnigri TaxID=857252 RepID=A0AAQ1G604_9GAMM|nr:hypothetical protein [Halopseudomonas aestusnigri]OWL89197.1 hypothetical protein B7O88_07920 [Halopseudomonas aestusnigri]SEG04884.1 hypothetical protein SAMN05216586_10362 [Halopseudomonas aestusnigri]
MHAIKRLLLAATLTNTTVVCADTLELQQLGLRTASSLLMLHGEHNGSEDLNHFYRLRHRLETSWSEHKADASQDETLAMQRLLQSIDTAVAQLQRGGGIELEHAEQMNLELRMMQSFWFRPTDDHSGQLQLALLDLNYRYLHRSYIGMPAPISLPGSGYYNAGNLDLINTLDSALTAARAPDHNAARWHMLKRMYGDLDSNWAQTPTAPVVVNLNANQLLEELNNARHSRP